MFSLRFFLAFPLFNNQDSETIQVFPLIIATNLERFHQSKQTTIMFSIEERLFSQRELTEKSGKRSNWACVSARDEEMEEKKSSRKSSLDIIRSYSNRFYHWFSPPRWLISVPKKNHKTSTNGDENHNWKSFLRDFFENQMRNELIQRKKLWFSYLKMKVSEDFRDEIKWRFQTPRLQVFKTPLIVKHSSSEFQIISYFPFFSFFFQAINNSDNFRFASNKNLFYKFSKFFLSNLKTRKKFHSLEKFGIYSTSFVWIHNLRTWWNFVNYHDFFF